MRTGSLSRVRLRRTPDQLARFLTGRPARKRIGPLLGAFDPARSGRDSSARRCGKADRAYVFNFYACQERWVLRVNVRFPRWCVPRNRCATRESSRGVRPVFPARFHSTTFNGSRTRSPGRVRQSPSAPAPAAPRPALLLAPKATAGAAGWRRTGGSKGGRGRRWPAATVLQRPATAQPARHQSPSRRSRRLGSAGRAPPATPPPPP